MPRLETIVVSRTYLCDTRQIGAKLGQGGCDCWPYVFMKGCFHLILLKIVQQCGELDDLVLHHGITAGGLKVQNQQVLQLVSACSVRRH